MTLKGALKAGQRYLEKRQIPDAKLDAWYLLEHILNADSDKTISRAWFLAHQDEEMRLAQYSRYQKLLEDRGTHIPLQHLTGQQEFMGIPFRVSKKVLIPRQDSEILVEEAMKILKPGMSVLDMCTGSGCIIISLMKYIPKLWATACDISYDALEVAKANADAQQINIDFRQGNLFEAIEGMYDMIISNPPYIPTKDIEELMDEVRKFDPILALDGGEDGLKFYRRLTAESKEYLKPGGWLMMEIGHDQGVLVSDMMIKAGYQGVYIVKDLAGQDRVVAGISDVQKGTDIKEEKKCLTD